MPNPQNQHGGNRNFQQGGRNNQDTPRDNTLAGKTQAQWNSEIQKWVQNGIEKATIVYADAMGQKLKNDGLTTSQIRNVFGEMRKIQMNGFEKEKADFLLLKPKLAYATKRQNAKGMDAFYDLFYKAYEAVEMNDIQKSSKQFDNLLQVMEAVLAYHKFHGGQ